MIRLNIILKTDNRVYCYPEPLFNEVCSSHEVNKRFFVDLLQYKTKTYACNKVIKISGFYFGTYHHVETPATQNEVKFVKYMKKYI